MSSFVAIAFNSSFNSNSNSGLTKIINTKDAQKILPFILFFTCLGLVAQKSSISGKVIDSETKEPLISAYVLLGENLGAVTDFDGNYTVEVENGVYQIMVSYVGYEDQTKDVEINGPTSLDFEMVSQAFLKEVVVTADIAKERETPVAFSTISPIQLQQELASQDLPMVLNSTPGVYATNQGGGDGEARVSIRGFNQRNVAVLLDGIPVNDMENGRVFWSNWFGLDLVTKTMQVQRGLGASKLAIPSVGGTINILTKGIDSKRNIALKQEVGVNGFTRTTLGYNSGRFANNWGVSAALSYKQGNGWVDGNFTKGFFYYLKVEKEFKKHLFSLSGFGAPQRHGQRSFKVPIKTVDAKFARDLFTGTDEQYNLILSKGQLRDEINDITADPIALQDQELLAQLRSNLEAVDGELLTMGVVNDEGNFDFNSNLVQSFIDTTGAGNFGYRHNQHANTLNGEIYNTRQNEYFKPQFSFRHSWSPTNKFFLSNVAYLSIGRGSGIAPTDSDIFLVSGQTNGVNLDIQRGYDLNQANGGSAYVMRSSVNNHFWYGLLSTARYSINELWTVSGGIDLRRYEGDHYRKVNNLLGAEYFEEAEEVRQLQVGDQYGYDYKGLVDWGGLFSLLEYSDSKVSAFLNLSGSSIGFGAESPYKYSVPTVENDSTVYLQNPYQVVTVDGVEYSADSPGATTQSLDTKWILGGTVKVGASYKLDKKNSVFANAGYLTKAQPFNRIILVNRFRDSQMTFFSDIQNEKITAIEAGYHFKSTKFAANVNAYRTSWENKPVENPPPVNDPERCDPTDIECDFKTQLNIQGINALHQGVEFDFAYKLHKMLTLEGLVSIGDWRWNSDAAVTNPNDASEIIYEFDATGVKVGDAAQTQLSGMVNFKPVKRGYLKVRGTYFGDNYSDFDPDGLQGDNARRQSWKMPNYVILDFHTGYGFKIDDKYKINWRFSILNLLNTRYITDAQNNDPFVISNPEHFFDVGTYGGGSASAHFGQGIRWNTSLKIQF